jgi:hypothetical protein
VSFWVRWIWLPWSISAGLIVGGVIVFGVPFVRTHLPRLSPNAPDALNSAAAPAGTAPPAGTPPVVCHVAKWPDASLVLSPSINTVKAGDQFLVQVMINTAAISKGAQFGLKYDPKLLKLLAADEGTFYKDWADPRGGSTLLVRGRGIDPEVGRLQTMGVAVIGGPDGGATGQGAVATLRFQALTGVSGQSTLALENAEISSFDNCAVARSVNPISITDGMVIVGAGSVPPPPLPRIATPIESMPG